MNDTIFYHEDFYRQIELVPEENYFTTDKFIDNLPSKKDSIYGFNTAVARPEQKIRLLDRKILLDEITEILNSISLFYSENVITGYGQYTQKSSNTVVWGFEQFGLFVKHQQSFVESIWLSDSPFFPQLKTCKHLANAIFSLSQKYSLILVDWNKEIICRVYSENNVRDYLRQNLSFDY